MPRRFVLRQSRAHSGLAQLFLALFALLATFAPGLDSPLPGNEAGEYVSAPAGPRADVALLRATLGAAADLEEEADEEEAASLVFATSVYCPAPAEYRAAHAWLPQVHRLSAHFCTGPPIL